MVTLEVTVESGCGYDGDGGGGDRGHCGGGRWRWRRGPNTHADVEMAGGDSSVTMWVMV